MAPRSKPTAELAAFLRRFARHEDPDLRAWIKSLRIERTLYGAWLACADGEPMLLVLGADLREEDQGSEVHRRLVLAACACARLALIHVPPNEPRVAQALEITERWARGDPSADPVEAQRIAAAVAVATWAAHGWGAGEPVQNAAWAAQDDWSWRPANAAASAARDAAGAARSATWAARGAGWAAWHTAKAARYTTAARGASKGESMPAQCAELVRREFPRPPYRDPENGNVDEATYWLQVVDDPSVDPAARQAAGIRVLEIEAEIQGG